jgi:outer membrane protein
MQLLRVRFHSALQTWFLPAAALCVIFSFLLIGPARPFLRWPVKNFSIVFSGCLRYCDLYLMVAKLKIHTLLLSLFLLQPLCIHAETTGLPILRLTLNQAYELALKLNEDEQIRKEELEIAEARYRQALSNYFPQISLFYSRQYRDRIDQSRTKSSDPSSLLAQQRALESGSYWYQYNGSFETRAQQNPSQAGISLTWPIFSGFRTYHESLAAREEITEKEKRNARERELLYRDIAEVFYQILQYEEAERIYEDEANALRKRIEEIRRLIGLGRAPQGDLPVARSDLANSLVQAEANRALVAASKELLGFLIGKPPEQWILSDEQTLPPARALEAYLERLDERKDLIASVQAIRAARERLESSRGGFLPDVSLDGAYLYRQSPDSGRDWNITLRITLPVFQGGSTMASVRESKAKLKISELQLERLRRLATYEVRQAYADYTASAAQLLLLRENVETARLAYVIQSRDYSLGIVTNLEVLSALSRYHQARLSLARTEALVRINQLRLHVAAGLEETR